MNAAAAHPQPARAERRQVSLGNRSLRASYDAAQTTDENAAHWRWADNLSANAANSPSVRSILRNRARYEFANNTYCKGILQTLANEVVGIGPRPQILGVSRKDSDEIEGKFEAWARAVRLGDLLRIVCITEARDGEIFALRITNPRLDHPVKLDIRLIEGEQCATTDLALGLSQQMTDGIEFDAVGNPMRYHVLKQHPGETAMFFALGNPLAYSAIDAGQVYHVFVADRPGQTRGIPHITPALPLFAHMRRFTLAVIGAAENAADMAGVIQTNSPAVDIDDVPPLDVLEMERRSWLTMPSGWGIKQIEAEQPATTYEMFKREIIKEIARCLDMPYNIAAGDSSKYNYASNKSDRQTFWRSLLIRRGRLERLVDWIFNTWIIEASKIAGYLPIPDADASVDRMWYWRTGEQHQDPAREANAQQTKLANRCTSHAWEYAKEGRDWEKEFEQIARERKRMRELGIEPALIAPGTPVEPDDADDAVEDDE